jgi:hypothetical protein
VSSWSQEPARDRDGWVGFVALACAVPALFLGLYFALDFLLRVIAGWFA